MNTTADTQATIRKLLGENPVVLFMKGNRVQPQCGFSAKTVAALDMLLADYVAVDVLRHPDIRDGIKEYGSWPTIPQLYVKGELIGGCDIVTGMFDSGELAEALGIAAPGDVTPAIALDPAVEEIMTNALAANAGMAVHLRIDAGWEHTLSLAPTREGTVTVRSGGITLHLDPWSASRADGLRIRVKESLQGQGFEFDNPNAPPPVRSLSVQDLKAQLDGETGIRVYDVRGADERAAASLAVASPWDESAMREIDGLDRDEPIAFLCHRGGRSRSVAEGYRRRGHTRVYNVEGGIDAWAAEIDSSIPRY